MTKANTPEIRTRYSRTVEVQTPRDGTIECGVINAECEICDDHTACIVFEREGVVRCSECIRSHMYAVGYMVVTFPFPN